MHFDWLVSMVLIMFFPGPAFLEPDYIHLWPKLLEALIKLFELPEDETIPADEHFLEVDDTPGGWNLNN